MRKIAISVGINDYADAPLAFCVNDAIQIAAVLEEEEYEFQLFKLMNDQATKENIQHHFDLVLNVRPDIFILYFSGHGCSTDLGTYIVTFDGRPYDEGIEVGLLARWLERFANQGTKVLAILDCCHSGAASPWPERARPMAPTEVEHRVGVLGLSRVVLAACRPNQWSLEEGEKQHGIFTYYLLDGLLGSAADANGSVSVLSLYDYASRCVEKTINPMPLLRGDISGGFVLGSGFPPVVQGILDDEALSRLEHEAQLHVERFSDRGKTTLQEWKLRGYNDTCRALEPVVRWFETQVAAHPPLLMRPLFKDCLVSLKARVAQLAHIDPGTHIAEGALERSLGEGAFGRVWLVRPRDNPSKLLAYKIYHPQDVYDDHKISRFERGYRAMRQLDHPWIVSVSSITKCPIGFLMEFVDGPNMRDIGGALEDPPEITSVMHDIAVAVAYAHGKGVRHRDIKPENIILSYHEETQKWIPHLTDFDLAWFSTATKVTKEAFGTMHYAAPEQFEMPKSNVAHAETVDIFAFGQLLFFVICKRDPSFRGQEENLRILRTALLSWPSAEAATQVEQIYRNCTMVRAKDRMKNFIEISKTMTTIADLLSAVRSDQILSESELLGEIAFRVSGNTGVKSGKE